MITTVMKLSEAQMRFGLDITYSNNADSLDAGTLLINTSRNNEVVDGLKKFEITVFNPDAVIRVMYANSDEEVKKMLMKK